MSGDASSSLASSVVHLVIGKASLLSGDLRECYNATDDTCVGGIASVAAGARYYSSLPNVTRTTDASNGNSTTPNVLILPVLDKSSPFVQMHPLAWSLNRYIFNVLMGWKVFLCAPSILTQSKVDYSVSQRDLSDLQTHSMPLLLSNVAVPPGNSWFPYTKAVFFDEPTSLAILVIDSSKELLNVDQIDSTKGLLDYIHRVNTALGCATDINSTSLFAEYDPMSFMREHVPSPNEANCWIPIVLFNHVMETWELFLPSIVLHEHPPALILDIAGNDANYSIPTPIGDDTVWVHSFLLDSDYYNHHVLSIAQDSAGSAHIQNVTFIAQEFKTMPSAVKDQQFATDITELRRSADEALEHDPIVGYSGFVPVHRDDPYRRCMGGECEVGNLFTDALRWHTGADVAFITSGGMRGRGWPAGPVRVSNLWEALIFPNTVCSGVLTGVSLFQVFNFSTSVATLEGAETETGGYLLQVSGMRVTYNTHLMGSRLVAIDIYDVEQDAYVPINRLRLYSFATDSFLCGVYEPYRFLLGEGLVFEGEQRGVISADLHQEVVANYLSMGLNGTVYDTSIQGRLVNNTEVFIPLNLVQNPDSCGDGTYWNEETFTCETCPSTTAVNFLSERVELTGQTGSTEIPCGTIVLVDSDISPVSVSLKSIPTWITLYDNRIADQKGSVEQGQKLDLQSGERVTLTLCASTDQLETGTAVASVAFGIWNGGESNRYLGCTEQDVTFDVFMRVAPSQDLNQLGSISIMGFVLAAVVSCTASYFCYCVLRHKKLRIVSTMQPLFLVAICIGVFIMGLALIPLGLDDGKVSEHGANIACMAIPWLFSMGFTITQSALFSKLWRINKLFNSPQMRRMQVHEKDVLGPFALLFILNFTILLVWTVVDPLQYDRKTVDGEIWNSYGHCDSDGSVGATLFALNCCVNIAALLCACYQAYKARNISDEFSESSNIGMAMFSWIQLVIIGVPVLFLISGDNPMARYFILASLMFAVCESMLLFIFVPILLQVRQHRKDPECCNRNSPYRASSSAVRNSRGETSSDQFQRQQRMGRTRVSGLNFDIDASKLSETIKEKAEMDCPDDLMFHGETIDELTGDSGNLVVDRVSTDVLIYDNEEEEYRC